MGESPVEDAVVSCSIPGAMGGGATQVLPVECQRGAKQVGLYFLQEGWGMKELQGCELLRKQLVLHKSCIINLRGWQSIRIKVGIFLHPIHLVE